ncbi:OX-2 membrane glycoprotein-like, partial [Centroberyx affinis]|uniref:OX-2 membrane glycoprotein-like n=1 Tax=Centroberyx affinis TaxID=166261 RepID=UPI003A5BB73D
MIRTQQTVMAKMGQDARFNCELTQSKEVHQVTWQRVLPEREENIGTYNNRSGPRVNSDFKGKVKFEDAGLQNCSIVIRRVTTQDEGCYRCLFNTYPEGALAGNTCLKVYEHEPTLLITTSNSGRSLVSCSATGRPAPTVTLMVPGRDFSSSNYSTASVTNANGTVTVTATAVLSGFHGNSTLVRCYVLFSGALMKVLTIPETITMSRTVGLDKEPAVDESSFRATMIGVVAA